jgi:hypothetical protein
MTAPTNIRPFVEAGVLSWPLDKNDVSGVLKAVDGGKDVSSAPWYHLFSGERRNDHRTTLAEKQAARARTAE